MTYFMVQLMEHAAAFIALSLLGIIGLAGCWDVYVTYFSPPTPTVSEVIQDWAVRLPVLPFSVGFLAGHLFWPRRP